MNVIDAIIAAKNPNVTKLTLLFVFCIEADY
jgi:hypothetical protein